jgi:hypothetical protein
MKEMLIGLLLSPEVWGAALLSIGLLVYRFVKGNTKQKIRGALAVAKQVFVAVEQIIPDDTENKTAKKIDAALEMFIKIYNDTFGKNPDAGLISLAQIIWKDLAAEKKLLK